MNADSCGPDQDPQTGVFVSYEIYLINKGWIPIWMRIRILRNSNLDPYPDQEY